MPFIPTDDGRWVSEDYERLARVVQDYDPRFELRWIPPEARTSPEDVAMPYVVWDTVTNTPVLFASETTTPQQILTRMFEGDMTKHSPDSILRGIEASEKAAKALEMKSKMDEAEERMDYAAHLIRNKNNYITLKNGMKVDDQLRPIL